MRNNILLLFLITTSTLSCNNKINHTNMNNEKLIRQYFDYFNAHEWQKMAELYIEDAEFKDPSLGQGIVKQSRQQTIEKYAGLQQIFNDLRDEIQQIYLSGNDHVIVEFISSGTGPDGSEFYLPICTIFTIQDGMIVKDFTYYDNFDESEETE